jgi:hypothetical protein
MLIKAPTHIITREAECGYGHTGRTALGLEGQNPITGQMKTKKSRCGGGAAYRCHQVAVGAGAPVKLSARPPLPGPRTARVSPPGVICVESYGRRRRSRRRVSARRARDRGRRRAVGLTTTCARRVKAAGTGSQKKSGTQEARQNPREGCPGRTESNMPFYTD